MAAIYLDHSATTPLDPEVFDAMLPFLQGEFGNPSSMHSYGRSARNAVDAARSQVAAAVGAHPREIVFTSGGSEADNLAIRGVLQHHRERGRHIVISAVEHEAVLTTARELEAAGMAEVTVVGCDGAGRLDAAEIAAAVRHDTLLVSVMLANNEVGTVQDLAEISSTVKSTNPAVLIHSDAVQALGRIQIDVENLGVDLLSLSAHKAYGPKGVGCLYVRQGVHLAAQITGGGQERMRRSGTENVAGIVGFGAAAELAQKRRTSDMTHQGALARLLADRVIEALPHVVLTGSALHRLANVVSFAVPAVPSEVLVTALDAEGVCVSGGSACSSGASVPSHVLAAMGLAPNVAQGPIRCSLGRSTTESEIEAAALAIITCVLRAQAVAMDRAAHAASG